MEKQDIHDLNYLRLDGNIACCKCIRHWVLIQDLKKQGIKFFLSHVVQDVKSIEEKVLISALNKKKEKVLKTRQNTIKVQNICQNIINDNNDK